MTDFDILRNLDIQVLRVFAALLEAQPQAVDLGVEQTHKVKLERTDPNYADILQKSAATLRSLHRRGLVSGNLQEPSGECVPVIVGGHLTPRARATMLQTYPGTPRTLGDAIQASVASGNEWQMCAVGRMLVNLL
ncbi:hypothetical protein [Methylovirgula sp. 4M-Z18]|uniref:hypothetical protein n=1 Tax=Methylovirgula sp. 4M-Z18 TaxID=2293567 RepID=UPI000E2E7410|nr:hypothetical protein [Methylovirgula sp. 4M-Z18]RFB78396.1 hypothetical protein DYH55_16780 [Methylovirgula sp. 4M-Z18]